MLSSLIFKYPQALPWVIGLELSLVALILLLYSRRHWILPALRILAVTVIVFSILRPVITRARRANERPPILILLDNSHSMSVIDSGRPPAEWVGIAAALGKLPPESRDKEIDAVQADCDRLSTQADDVARARDELDYAKLSGRGVDAAQDRLAVAITELQATARAASTKAAPLIRANQLEKTLAYLEQIPAGIDRETWLDHVRDKARNTAADAEQARFASDARLYRTNSKIRDACLPLQSLSRLRLAQTQVLMGDQGLIAQLGINSPVLGYAISDRVTPLSIRDPHLALIPADGTVSNLTGGVRAVLQSLQANPPRALVLFSDGRQVSDDSDAPTLSVLTSIPIYTVGMAARNGIKDFSIQNVQVNAEAGVGQKSILTADIRGLGMRGISADITLTGGGPTQTRRVVFAEDRAFTVSFDFQFIDTGPQRLILHVAPVPGELSYENNRVERWINVMPKISTTPRPATRPVDESEMTDLTGDESWLRHLSESSGGQFFRLDQVDLLSKRLADLREDENHQMEIPLWDSPYLFCLVLGCLACEWGLRKHYGMV